MKIHTKDFRVAEGGEVDLGKWPTKVDAVYKSNERYKKLLEQHEMVLVLVLVPPPLTRYPIKPTDRRERSSKKN